VSISKPEPRALVLGLVLAFTAVACGARSPSSQIGVSDRHPARTPATEQGDGGVIDGAAFLPAGYRASFTKVNKGRLVSLGHASGRWEVDVWANEPALAALAARSHEVPAGAIVVEEHFERRPDAVRQPGPIMMMEKRSGFSAAHGDWRWVVVGSRGQLVKEGVVESCAGCHDDSPMDGLFPIVE
jgi:hypothetical protein